MGLSKNKKGCAEASACGVSAKGACPKMAAKIVLTVKTASSDAEAAAALVIAMKGKLTCAKTAARMAMKLRGTPCAKTCSKMVMSAMTKLSQHAANTTANTTAAKSKPKTTACSASAEKTLPMKQARELAQTLRDTEDMDTAVIIVTSLIRGLNDEALAKGLVKEVQGAASLDAAAKALQNSAAYYGVVKAKSGCGTAAKSDCGTAKKGDCGTAKKGDCGTAKKSGCAEKTPKQ